MSTFATLAILTLPIVLAGTGATRAEPNWPNSPVNRWQAQALTATLDADLLGSRSATLTLEKWCSDHRLAEPALIVADQVAGIDKPITAEQRARLQVSPDEPIRYRHVRLRCGGVVLSEADNWYVPARLTPEMNRLLETTDTPFGKVVAELKPYRRTFEVRHPWSATAAPGDAPRIDLPQALFAHRAVLYTAADHVPFSEVDEVYQRGILDFAPQP